MNRDLSRLAVQVPTLNFWMTCLLMLSYCSQQHDLTTPWPALMNTWEM